MTGHDIRKRRLEAGLKQWQLALRAGISETTLRRYETGRYPVSPANLVAIENALGSPVSVDHAPEAKGPRTARGFIGRNQPAATSKASAPPRADVEGV